MCRRAGQMPLVDVLEAGRPGPAPVAVEHDRDVAGDRQPGEMGAQPSLVDRVDGAAKTHDYGA